MTSRFHPTVAFDETSYVEKESPDSAATQLAPSVSGVMPLPVASGRTTVLPKLGAEGDGGRLQGERQDRYEPTKLLGVGGMGEVILVHDNDIARRVALKRLPAEMNDAAIVARFVDEIRTVGRLEHPNIVPIHDVGVDELGRYFFVMKYVEGETLEDIIAKLAAGDPAYLARYSIEVRIELFLGLLHALDYAHSRGIIHRDIKPANVMVGRFGEVVLMDWGIAKPIRQLRDAAREATDIADAHVGARERFYATRVGSLIGTPMYMSPEQARGDHTSVDERSDLYSAAVVFHELMGLKHLLDGVDSMDGLLAKIQTDEFGFLRLLGLDYPHGTPPAELLHFVMKGVAKSPSARFQSARSAIEELHQILEGRVRVQCHITLTKRVFRELGRLVDRRPWLAFATLLLLSSAVLFSLVAIGRSALG